MRHTAIIKKIKEITSSVAPDAEVILYGSQARRDARPDSDIDLLILLDKEQITNADIEQVTYPLYELALQGDCSVCISPLVYTRKQWYGRPFRTPFFINVMNEGVVL
jgi:predicted nucleotidyltransferase